MSYEILEKQIRALPERAQQEVAHYVGYLSVLYRNSDGAVAEQVDTFMRDNPRAFGEFAPVRGAGLAAVRELTKHDSW